MKIITISRQFGSGGREVGKRLADILGWDYYDREIIQTLCREEGLSEEYVNRVIHNHEWSQVPLHFGSSFTGSAVQSWQLSLLQKETAIIKRIAQQGQNCIIVGRDADVILEEYKPFRVYICADMDARLKRCQARETEGRTEKELLKEIKQVDKRRSQTRDLLTAGTEDPALNFEMTLNVTHWDLKNAARVVAEAAEAWFGERQ